MLAPAGIDMFPPVPVMMTLLADESVESLLLIVRAVVAALIKVRMRPSAPPAMPVRVWADAPVKRTNAPVIDWLFRLPVVDMSLAFWKATLPPLVTVNPAWREVTAVVTVSPFCKVVSPPTTVRVLVPVTEVLPFSETTPEVVPKVPEPLKAIVGLEVALPMLTALALVPAMLMAAAPPVSMPTALAPVELSVSVLPPVTVRAALEVSTVELPKETVPPPAWIVKVPAPVLQVAAAALVRVKAPELVVREEAALPARETAPVN
jgi:hypothetical protein